METNIHPFKITNYLVIRWFQICIIHNILVTNKLLYHMKIKNDPRCTFCAIHDENTSHLLWKCQKTHKILLEN